MKKEVLEKWDNICIKVLSDKHGRQVINFWKSIGVNTNGWTGESILFPFYGLFNGKFANGHEPLNKVLTLEEAIAIRDNVKTFPREMVCYYSDVKNAEKHTIVYIFSDTEKEKHNVNYPYIGLKKNFKYAMEIEEYEAMNKNKEILNEIDNTKKQMNELNDKLSQLQDKLKY